MVHTSKCGNLVGGGSISFSHDENGNLTHGDGEIITYNAFNKPTRIEEDVPQPLDVTEFEYGADLMRYKRPLILSSAPFSHIFQ